jgi:hypothetical protein
MVMPLVLRLLRRLSNSLPSLRQDATRAISHLFHYRRSILKRADNEATIKCFLYAFNEIVRRRDSALGRCGPLVILLGLSFI